MTDRPDYAPGATAQISGSGFQPNDTIRFQVVHTDGAPDVSPANDPWTVVDDAGGTFQTTWYVEPASSADHAFRLTDSDLNTGEVATTTFTDASVTNVGTASDTGSSARTTVSANLTAAVPPNSTMIVAVSLNTNAGGAVSVADTHGKTYRPDADVTNPTGVRTLVFSALTATALAINDPITVMTPAGISDKAVQVSIVSDMRYAEGSSSNKGTSSQPNVPSFSTQDPTSTNAYTIFGAYGAVTNSAESMSAAWYTDGSKKSGVTTGLSLPSFPEFPV